MAIRGKKAMMFTLTALVLITFTITMGYTHILSERQSEQLVINSRLHSMNQFIGNVQSDAQVALYTAGFRGILALVEQVTLSGEYIPDAQGSLEELIINGTYQDIEISIMDNNTLPYWLENIQAQAQVIGVAVEIDYGPIILSHYDAWSLNIHTILDLSIYDQRGLAAWNTTLEVNARVPIEGFDDPLYVVSTANQFTNIIEKSPYSGQFVVNGSASNLIEHMEKGYYVEFGRSPSFLQRIQGDFNASVYGIESLVDKVALSQVMPVVMEDTNVDFKYFHDIPHQAYYFTITPPEFVLDNKTDMQDIGRIQFYNLSDHVE